MNNINKYLRTCRELNRLCTQNGWIDDDSITHGVIERQKNALLIAVTFEEIIVEAAGCIGGRIPCHGRMRISFREDGSVEGAEVL